MSATALIVDDEQDIRELLSMTLARMDVATDTAASVSEAKQLLADKQYQICLTDMRLPDGNGLELIEYMQSQYPHIPVALITAYGNVDLAVNALKSGAFDFISKPIDLENLRSLIKRALQLQVSESAQPALKLLGQSDSIIALDKQIDKLARSQAPVFINGQSGVGKELVARLIHTRGPRSEAPFVAVNCGAIPAELMESEFFGHTKGSFTGAQEDKDGLFQAANTGTLFLDEVADLPLTMQVKLLRAIQERAVRKIGAQQETQVDVRILSASHKNLKRLVDRGEFRDDLFYRINVIDLNVPSLSERGQDVILLAEYILQKLAEQNKQVPCQLSKDAQAALLAYPFPGNVRELENILERAVILCEGDNISAEDLQLPALCEPHEKDFVLGEQSLTEHLEDIEKHVILEHLEKYHWNRTAAAEALGVTMRSLRYRMKKLGIAGEHDDEE